eukprot:6190512-Pyramimonas_sp.AAC.1
MPSDAVGGGGLVGVQGKQQETALLEVACTEQSQSYSTDAVSVPPWSSQIRPYPGVVRIIPSVDLVATSSTAQARPRCKLIASGASTQANQQSWGVDAILMRI